MRSVLTPSVCSTCWLQVAACKPSAVSEYGGTLMSQLAAGLESSSDDHSSPVAGSQVSSCAVSRRTSVGPQLRTASEDAGHVSTSESHENSIVRAKQQCGAEILNFEHLKMQLDKLTGQNREKQQRQSDAENGTSTISPSPSSACLCSQAAAAANLPCVGSWPLGLDRTPSVESDVVLPTDSGVSSMRLVNSFAADSVMALLCKCTGVGEQKLLASGPAWTVSSAAAATVQGDPLVSGVGGNQHMKPEASVSAHQYNPSHHHQHVAACHDLLPQPSVIGTYPPAMNASNTVGAFQQSGHVCDSLPAACFTDWQHQQQQLLLQQIQQQQMQVQHPLLMQMLHYQQQQQLQQQAIQLMQSTLLPSQPKPPDLMPNAFVGPVPVATGLPLQYLHWQTRLANLLIESGLLPAKAHELVQQLQQIMLPVHPVQFPGPFVLQSGCNIGAVHQLNNHVLSSQFSAGGLPWALLPASSNVQAAYAKVVQLLAQPNPLVTPELLEAMFAQLPPPLNLNASSCLNPRVLSELLYRKLVEFLTMQSSRVPVTPMQLTPPASVYGFFGLTTANTVDSFTCMNKSEAVQTRRPSVEDKSAALSMGSMQVGTPSKLTRTSSSGLDGSSAGSVMQNCPLHRGASIESESGDVPGAKVSGVPRTGAACSRHHSVPAGNGAKVSGISMPKKNVDCPQGLADLDMALKEKLRPRTTKGIGQPEHSKAGTVVTVTSTMSTVTSSFHHSVAAAACDVERTCVTCMSGASNGNTITLASRNTSAVTLDASTVPKVHSVSVAKGTGISFDENKADAVRKQEGHIVRETVCKASDVTIGAAASSRLKTVSQVPGNTQLPEAGMDVVVKPHSSAVCTTVAASSGQFAVAAMSSAQFRECASDHCLPAAVSVSHFLLPNSDINRQHVSDSAIASATTQLAQKHLQKKMAPADQETISATDVTARQSHPVTAVSSCFFEVFTCFVC